jgi:hypothetical protein
LLLLLPLLLLLLCADGEVPPHLVQCLGALPLPQVGQQRSLKVALADGKCAWCCGVPAGHDAVQHAQDARLTTRLLQQKQRSLHVRLANGQRAWCLGGPCMQV